MPRPINTLGILYTDLKNIPAPPTLRPIRKDNQLPYPQPLVLEPTCLTQFTRQVVSHSQTSI